MATDDSARPDPGSNPKITDIEPVSVEVRADHGVGGVALEIVDRDGNGFRTILDQPAALDVVLKVVAAVARLRRYPGTS